MTDVATHLKQRIRVDGPISVAEFMQIVLTARGDSYYRKAEPIGAAGDFITAPEISQIFGELIGLWCVDVWQKLGAPTSLTLAELGPGRGTLMKDVLRAARVVPAFVEAASVAMIEVSEVLRREQQQALRGARAAWFERFEEVRSEGPIIVLANEFFDALPIRQFVRTDAGWRERCVGLRGDALAFGAAPDAIPPDAIPAKLRQAPVGTLIEVAPARVAMAQTVGARIVRRGGAALAIDYGFEGPFVGDTLQAMKAHAYTNVFFEPGTADLTSHVDFTALADGFAAGGAAVSPVAGQGAFLNRLGAFERLQVLKRGATAQQSAQLDAAYARLTGAEAMGTLFKVLCAHAPMSLQPAGFSDP